MGTVLTVSAALSAVIWLYLLFGRSGFWRGRERLSPDTPEPASWPRVIAVVPARNEAETIEACATALSRQDYPGDYRVIVVDDGSQDETADIVKRLADKCARPISVISGTELASGWTGKLWALDQGVKSAVSRVPELDFLWFTDADVVHGPSVLRRLVSKAMADDCGVVSLMVRLRCEDFWEKLLIPAFIFFFQKLYPFPAVNNPARRMAGAAGGCILIRRKALEAAGGLDAIHDRLIDDCALAAAVQKAGGKLWLGLAEDSHSIRAYTHLKDVWDMVARTAFTQLGYSWAKLVGTVLGMVLIYVLPPLVVLTAPIHNMLWPTLLAGLAWAMMSIAYGPTLAYYERPPASGILSLPIAAALYTAMTVSSAWRHFVGRGGLWKDRHYQSAAQRP